MSNQYDKHVFLICDSVTHEDFIALAKREYWKLISEDKGDGKLTGFEQVWIAMDGKTKIHYVDEPGLGGIRFIVLHGPGENEIVDVLGAELALRTSINVIRLAREAQSDDEKCLSAYELAVVFVKFDPRAMEILKSYYYGGSDKVRIRVAQALRYRGWPEGAKFLEEIAKVDDYPELRDYAAKMADNVKAMQKKD